MTNYTVGAQETSSGITLSSGDTETVLSGGTSLDTTIRGGTETVSGGGTDSGTTISSGQETVEAGGTASGVAILGGTLEVLGGTVDGIVGSNAGIVDLEDGASLAIPGALTNSNGGFVYVDAFGIGSGGSTLTIGGTLINSGTVDIGYSGNTSATVVSAAGLANTGTIEVTGGTAKATLDITGAAPATLSGTLELVGSNAVVEFGSGAISAIAGGGTLELEDGASFAISGALTNSNGGFVYVDAFGIGSGGSTLTIGGTLINSGTVDIGYSGSTSATVVSAAGLANTGTIEVTGGTAKATLDITGALTNSNGGFVDVDGFGSGGSTLTIGGTLTNSGTVDIGYSGNTSATVVSAAGLANTGTIEVTGGTAKATLDITGAAPATLSGTLELVGSNAVVEFGSGAISAIAGGGTLELEDGASFAISGALTNSNGGFVYVDAFGIGSGGSTLTIGGTLINSGTVDIGYSGNTSATVVSAAGLANTGTIEVTGGTAKATLDITGALTNSNGGFVDVDGFGSGGSTLTIGGTLTNSGTVDIGYSGNTSATVVSAAGLANTGTIEVTGGTAKATLDITGAAPATLSGTLELVGSNAVVEFGSGAISAIAGGGTLELEDGASFAISGALTNSNGGFVYVDAFGIGSGGSTLTIGGTLINSGTVDIGYSGSTSATVVSAAGLANTGTIEVTGGTAKATLDITGSGSDAGSITVTGHTLLSAVGGLTVTSGGSVTVSSGGTAVDVILASAGSAIVSAGGIASATTILNGGSEIVSSGGTTSAPTINGGLVDLASGSIVSGGITFAGSGGTIEFENSVQTSTTISGLGIGTSSATLTDNNDVDLRFIASSAIASATISGTTVTLFNSGDTTLATLTLNAAPGSGTFVDWFADGSGGTDLVLADNPCFCRGTLILTERGEIAVEALAIGDQVVTEGGWLRPIKWIGRRDYDGRFVAGNRAVLPIRVAAGAIADRIPVRDLWVSPEHALYIDGALVPARHLVNQASIVQVEDVEQVCYFHIELDTHDVIFADGAPAESFVDDDSRGMFHNVAQFRALYPDAPTHVPASYCAPRIEEGFELEALRRRLLGRARRLGADGAALLAVLRGNLDLVHRERIEGWAHDPASPDMPVALIILANGAEIGRVVADRYRRDLDEAGIGDGHRAFELILPGGLAAGVRHEIEVYREADWNPLPGSPGVLEPAAADLDQPQPRPSAAVSLPLGRLRGNLDTCDRTRITGWAQDTECPGRSVGLVVTINDRATGRVLANRYRSDLETAGIGDGHHGFELRLPNGLSALQAHEIRVRREADGAELPGSPHTLPAANGFDSAVEQTIEDILSGAAAGAAEDRALAFLTQQADRLLARRAERHGGSAEREAYRLFRRRWGGQEADGPGSIEAPRPRALVVDLHVPCATRDAGSVAILSHVRALRALGYAVTFAASDEMGNATALARLAEDEGFATCGSPYYSCVEDVLCRQAGSFDLVYLHRAVNADRYLPLARRYCPKARVIYSVADLHHLRFARQAQVERRPELLAHSRYLAAIESLAARRADIVITHSPVEAELLRREAGIGKVHVVPFAVAPRKPRRPFAKRQGVTVLGSFEHAPNPDAVHYLIRDILPLVWATDRTLTCKIVGHGWHDDWLPRLDPRIGMVGEVDDLDDVFDTVRLTVAPLRFGAGIKGKVLDSFAAGLPCVMTPIAAEGLTLTRSLAELVANDPAGLAELILRLHTDQAANEQAGMEGVRMAAQQFSADRVIDSLRDILQPTSRNPVPDHNQSGDNPKMTSAA